MLLGFHVVVVLVLSLQRSLACGVVHMSVNKLRISELVIFGLPAAFFLMLQHRVTLEDAAAGFHAPALAFLAAAYLHLRDVHPEHLAAPRS